MAKTTNSDYANAVSGLGAKRSQSVVDSRTTTLLVYVSPSPSFKTEAVQLESQGHPELTSGAAYSLGMESGILKM